VKVASISYIKSLTFFLFVPALLAGCYKVCNDGRIAHSVRAKAGELGWSQWQEMRIVGIEPDAMAYGAIIRLCGARGQAERAMNLLEEMDRFEVKPTTLCFSSALRAVAKSHEIAIRFERGWSRKQLRRELFAAHHGNLARNIVIMAENAEVELDEGFVSSLMLCAAAAGDSATAKAIYLAAEVRKLENLRTVGPNSHLQRLRGEPGITDPSLKLASGRPSQLLLSEEVQGTDSDVQPNKTVSSHPPVIRDETAVASDTNDYAPSSIQERKRLYPSYGEREYGKDTRALSALLRSCAQAVNSNGIGTLWQGSQNQGFLDENSLRLITTRGQPSYRDKSIPGVNTTKVGIGALRRYDEDEREGRNKKDVRKKFRGLYLDDDAATTIDELDDTFAQMFVDDNGRPIVHQNNKPITLSIDAKSEMLDGNRVDDISASFDARSGKIIVNGEGELAAFQSEAATIGITKPLPEPDRDSSSSQQEDELYFDYDAMRWKNRPKIAEKPEERQKSPSYFETQRLQEMRNELMNKDGQQLDDTFDIMVS
jgi:pentatricopeptide repeat protein